MLASTTMNIPKIHGYSFRPLISHLSQNVNPTSPTSYLKSQLCHISSPTICFSYPKFPTLRTNAKVRHVRISEIGAPLWTQKDDEENTRYSEDLTMNGDVYQKTLRLVECSMFAALGGLVYILSSSLAIEVLF